jgi:hypothetical protein
MPYVFFVISALAGATGYALLRWSRPRPEPVAETPLAAPRPVRVEEFAPLPKPLRVTVFVTVFVGESAGEPRTTAITLPDVSLAETGERPMTSTTYLVDRVEVELHDFFDSFAMRSRQVAHNLRYCDLVVRGEHVIARAAVPLGILMADNPDLVETCAHALTDPAHRPAFRDRVGEIVRGGAVLSWLERHEQALAQPLPETRVDTADLAVPKPPWQPADQHGWPFAFRPRQTDDEAAKPS